MAMTPAQLDKFMEVVRTWEKGEGFVWLRSMETHYIKAQISPQGIGMNKCLHRLGVRRTTMMPDRLLQKRHPQNHPHLYSSQSAFWS